MCSFKRNSLAFPPRMPSTHMSSASWTLRTCSPRAQPSLPKHFKIHDMPTLRWLKRGQCVNVQTSTMEWLKQGDFPVLTQTGSPYSNTQPHAERGAELPPLGPDAPPCGASGKSSCAAASSARRLKWSETSSPKRKSKISW